jgi:hypothetical protein
MNRHKGFHIDFVFQFTRVPWKLRGTTIGTYDETAPSFCDHVRVVVDIER